MQVVKAGKMNLNSLYRVSGPYIREADSRLVSIDLMIIYPQRIDAYMIFAFGGWYGMLQLFVLAGAVLPD